MQIISNDKHNLCAAIKAMAWPWLKWVNCMAKNIKEREKERDKRRTNELLFA